METNKKLWLAVNECGEECLYIGEEPPVKSGNGEKWDFEGEIIVLPKGSIRNLSQKYNQSFNDDPIKFNRKLMAYVSFKRNNKNTMIRRLLAEKYGEVNKNAGYFKEIQDAIEWRKEQKGKYDRH